MASPSSSSEGNTADTASVSANPNDNQNPTGQDSGSRVEGFRKLTPAQRIEELQRRGFLANGSAREFLSGTHTLSVDAGNRMIENVVGVLGLPVGLGLNFLINDQDYIIPLAVEEPSIVAALSSAAKIARAGGGYRAEQHENLIIGQVQAVAPPNPEQAMARIREHRDELLARANELHPNMIARGAGAREVEVHRHLGTVTGQEMIVVHLLVDTGDAMGANVVNSMCEGIAEMVEELTETKVFLRILSNLTDRAIARAEVRLPVAALANKRFSGEAIRDGIILAGEFAMADPYRAATHNKGIMNGIDPLAVATGNDWRAIEAAAHAYAARSGRYTSLTEWRSNDAGDLVGTITIPMKVGVVGGPLQSNRTVALNHEILGATSASELAGIMAAVGLAQNFSALKALSTEGIQRGHMALHARTVTNAAGVNADMFEQVVTELIDSGEIKVWKAQEVADRLRRERAESHIAPVEEAAQWSRASGKIILLGEHSAVYGRTALAAPIPLAMVARVTDADAGVRLRVPAWRLDQPVEQTGSDFTVALNALLRGLGLTDRPMVIEARPNVPSAMGLGASAALAVAVIRALDRHFALNLSDAEINALAYQCESAVHGNASGVDNTVATYGRALSYRKTDDGGEFDPLIIGAPMHLVIGMSAEPSLTAETVAQVRARWSARPARYERVFDQLDELAVAAQHALKNGDTEDFGELTTLCHGLLNGLRLSTPQLEQLVRIAHDNGALGAKLTGGGGGGSMFAVCPPAPAGETKNEAADRIVAAMAHAGFRAMEVTLG